MAAISSSVAEGLALKRYERMVCMSRVTRTCPGRVRVEPRVVERATELFELSGDCA